MGKKILFISLLTMGFTYSQTALYNSGNLRIHQEGQLGFHTDLVNDGPFDENVGLTGFYGTEPITISGALNPVLYDVEVVNDSGIWLETSLGVDNNTNFIAGDIITPRNNPAVHYSFFQNALTIGENNGSKVEGYAMLSGQGDFSFPVGDQAQLRPLAI
ncbi:MAG: gliding motility-associated C-terminal domain-containing protein, partial [Flavobacteriaceae bacterium]|nr:gliding motility-associated C-terminal domain-containing protein [Muriicola sp.]NNL40589.1 gliding motility-associated C-terminal domain-containing protein [Flavobacteriaceae bacterium]